MWPGRPRGDGAQVGAVAAQQQQRREASRYLACPDPIPESGSWPSLDLNPQHLEITYNNMFNIGAVFHEFADPSR